MAKKAGRKRTTKTAKAPEGGSSDYKAELPDEVVASMWTLTDEGHSQRKVAALLKLAPSTVSKHLAKDPFKLEALRARQREERARGYARIEDLGLAEIEGWLVRMAAIRKGFAGRGKMSEKKIREMTLLPRFLTACKTATESATKMHQLLTGGLTDRIGMPGRGADIAEDGAPTAESLIEMALDLGKEAVETLPDSMKIAAKAEAKRRGIELV